MSDEIAEKILKKLDVLDVVVVKLDVLENRFDGLEGRFDGLENRFGGLDGRFDGLEARLDELHSDLHDLVLPKLNEMDSRLEKTEISHVSLDLYVREKLVTRDEFTASNAKALDALENVTHKVQRIEDDNLAKGEWMKRVETRLQTIEGGRAAA